MKRARPPILAAVLIGLAACATATTKPAPSASGSPVVYPSGAITPRPSPSIGTASPDTGKLQIAYVWPHLLFTATGVPAGTFSVIYVVESARGADQKLQIDATDAQASFLAKLEYLRLQPGDYDVRAFVKGAIEPFETRRITVP